LGHTGYVKKRLTVYAYYAYNLRVKFQEIEQIVLKDGWTLKAVKGSHYQYVHPSKSGKVTIPYHTGDIAPVIIKSILKQAGLK
jgi:predicted RNA binding protein YcfA (HicA-like mRNA interferase family)